MRLYDGENVEGFNAQDLQELKEEYPDEGMSGIDPNTTVKDQPIGLVFLVLISLHDFFPNQQLWLSVIDCS